MPATALPHVGAGHARDPQYAATKQRQSIVLVFTGNHERSARYQNPVNVGFFSYLIACAAYLVLTTLLLISWRGRALGSLAIGGQFLHGSVGRRLGRLDHHDQLQSGAPAAHGARA